MSEPPRSERIKPSLLDRLTDDDPGSVQESRLQRVVAPERYVKLVVRDLLWLFSVRAHSADLPIPADVVPRARVRRGPGAGGETTSGAPIRRLADYPEVARSVLRYGVPDLIGLPSASMTLPQLGKDLEEAVRLFEPRINPRTLRIRAVTTKEGRPERPGGAVAACPATSLSFEVSADVWLEPIPEHLHLRTVIDLDTGQCEIADASS